MRKAKEHTDELSYLRREAARLLVRGERPSSVARAMSINQSTIYRWMALPEFQAYLRELDAERERLILISITSATANAFEPPTFDFYEELRRLVPRALKQLAALLDCENPRIRLKVATLILGLNGFVPPSRVPLPVPKGPPLGAERLRLYEADLAREGRSLPPAAVTFKD